MNGHTVAVDGIRMRWLEQGTGSPVIFIPKCPLLWRHVVPRVRDARCLAFEMVGYGTSISEGESRDISVARQAEYLHAWAQAIGIRSAVLVGHDLGGGIAQIAAVRHPGFCRGLLLTNAIGYDSQPIPSGKIWTTPCPSQPSCLASGCLRARRASWRQLRAGSGGRDRTRRTTAGRDPWQRPAEIRITHPQPAATSRPGARTRPQGLCTGLLGGHPELA